MSILALIISYLAVFVNSVFVLCLWWFEQNPGNDFMGGFVLFPAIICWLISIPSVIIALAVSFIACGMRGSTVHSVHALAASLVACALATTAFFMSY